MKVPNGHTATPAEWQRYWRWTLIEGFVKIGAILLGVALLIGWLVTGR